MRKGLLAASASIFALLAAPAAHTVEVVALASGGGSLARFDKDAPATITSTAITGIAMGQTLVSIDVRPSTGQLYGLAVQGNQAQLYDIDPDTGAASAVAPAVTVNGISSATRFEMDIDGIFDTTRVIDDLASDGAGGNTNNFRITSGGAGAIVDPDLDYSALAGGAAEGPVVGIADVVNLQGGFPGPFPVPPLAILGGSDRLGALSTPAFFGSDFYQAVSFNSSFGFDAAECGGFDVIGPSSQGYAIFRVGGVSGLYAIATNGAATPLGAIGDGSAVFAGMTVLHPQPTVQWASDSFEAAEESATAQAVIACVDCDYEGATVSYHTVNGTARAGLDYLPDAQIFTFMPGETTHNVNLYVVDDYTPRGSRSFQILIDATNPVEVLGSPDTTTVTIVDDDGYTIPLAQLSVKPGALAKWSGKGSYTMPAAASADPTQQGGTLTLAGASGDVVYDLPAGGWQAAGAGFKYKDASCKVSVSDKQISASCKGDTGTLALPEAGPVSAVLALGDLRYCGECGGAASGNPAKIYKRKACAAPVACPAP